MALGSSAYPDVCKAGKDMDRAFTRLGAEPLSAVQFGDELDGQAQSVREWQVMCFPVLRFCRQESRWRQERKGGGGMSLVAVGRSRRHTVLTQMCIFMLPPLPHGVSAVS